MADKDIETIIDDVVRDMGLEPDKPARWKPNYYYSQISVGGRVLIGYTCSRCGIHSYSRKDICPGCGEKKRICDFFVSAVTFLYNILHVYGGIIILRKYYRASDAFRRALFVLPGGGVSAVRKDGFCLFERGKWFELFSLGM